MASLRERLEAQEREAEGLRDSLRQRDARLREQSETIADLQERCAPMPASAWDTPFRTLPCILTAIFPVSHGSHPATLSPSCNMLSISCPCKLDSVTGEWPNVADALQKKIKQSLTAFWRW